MLDYIPGKTLEECWPSLGLWRRLRIIWTLRGYIRQLRRIQPRNTLHRIAFPGPFGSEPQMCYGPMFTEYVCLHLCLTLSPVVDDLIGCRSIRILRGAY